MILALDQGTSSSRAMLFAHDGSVVALAQREFTQHFPQPGWSEHDPIEIWETQLAVALEALTQAQCSPQDLAGIGITNQRETTLLWNRKTGEPIHNAIVWHDRRTADMCVNLEQQGAQSIFRQKTGLLIDPYFSGTKVNWLLNHVDGARELAHKGDLAFGTIDSWLVWKLTQGTTHITDVTNASRTLLFNIHTLQWDKELLDILDIPSEILPAVKTSSEVVGYAHTLPGFSGTPICGIAGDQHAALFGQTCFAPGMAKNTYGTGCFLLMHTGDQPMVSEQKLLTTIAWQLGDRVEYALEGSVFTAGAAIQWLRDELKVIRHAADTETIAQSVTSNGGVYVVPAFSGLGAPHWDPFARGTITGLTRGSTAAHIVRATLESIAFQSADLIDAMHADTAIELQQLRVDGGASANSFLMQFQADILGVSTIRPQQTETTALGAAYLAGLAIGFWKDRKTIAQQWGIDQTFTPSLPTARTDELKHKWQLALNRAKGWACAS